MQAPSKTTDPVLGINGRGVTLTNVHALEGHQGAVLAGTNLVIDGASTADVNLDARPPAM